MSLLFQNRAPLYGSCPAFELISFGPIGRYHQKILRRERGSKCHLLGEVRKGGEGEGIITSEERLYILLTFITKIIVHAHPRGRHALPTPRQRLPPQKYPPSHAESTSVTAIIHGVNNVPNNSYYVDCTPRPTQLSNASAGTTRVWTAKNASSRSRSWRKRWPGKDR